MRVSREGNREVLRWDPPRAGQPVVEYEVYASTDRALSPRREATICKVTSTTIDLPATLIGTSRTTAFEVTDRQEVSYRVVAVDADGSRGAPSPIVTAPRPVWLPATPPVMIPGKPYRFQPRVRHSTGRWVLSLHEGLVREKVDELRFRLAAGPQWLTVDTSSGELSGTAPAALQEPIHVTLEVRIKDMGPAAQTFVIEPQR